jgi:CRP-like cAMP-binding protein
MEKYINILKETDIFYNLTHTQLSLICGICDIVTYNSNEIIFEENSEGAELFIILSGQVDIVLNPRLVSRKDLSDTELHSISTLRRGQSFGEIALLDQGLRSAGAVSMLKNTKLVKIHKDKMMMLCEHYPELGYRVMQNIALDLAHKLRNADLMIREHLLSKKS